MSVPLADLRRALRGGSWTDGMWLARAGAGLADDRANRDGSLGLRLLRRAS